MPMSNHLGSHQLFFTWRTSRAEKLLCKETLIISSLREPRLSEKGWSKVQPKPSPKKVYGSNPSRAHPLPLVVRKGRLLSQTWQQPSCHPQARMQTPRPHPGKVKRAAKTEPNLCGLSPPLLLPVCLWHWLWHIGYHTDSVKMLDSLTPWISPTNSRNWLYHIDLTNVTELTPSTDSTKYWFRPIGCASLFYSFAFCWFLFFFSIWFISV